VFRGSIAESAASGEEVLLNIPLSLASRDGLVGGMISTAASVWTIYSVSQKVAPVKLFAI